MNSLPKTSCDINLDDIDKSLPFLQADNNSCKTVFVCEFCSVELNQISELQDHIEAKHRNRFPFRCEFCTQRFPSRIDAETHVSAVHTNVIKLHNCVRCGDTFYSLEDLVQHVNVKHVPPITLPPNTVVNNMNHVSAVRTKVIKVQNCVHCGDTFYSLEDLVQHVILKHLTPTTLPPKPPESSEPKRAKMSSNKSKPKSLGKKKSHEVIEIEDDEPGIYLCTVCRQEFNFKTALIRHLKEHSVPIGRDVTEWKYKCTFCTKKFDHIQSLQLHSMISVCRQGK